MKTHFEFESDAYGPMPGEDDELVNPGMYGKALSLHLGKQLKTRGYAIRMLICEDWGWYTEFEHPGFRLAMGCGTMDYEEDDEGNWIRGEFVCFAIPSTPTVRKWFKKIETRETVCRNVSRSNVTRSLASPGITWRKFG